jgi:hypothetical protein
VRPLAEYVANSSGGFENPGSFKLETQEDRQRLRDWRLTFWQTRAMTSLDCSHLDGQLTARQKGSEVTIANDTELTFESVAILGAGRHMVGPIKPFQATTVNLPKSELPGSDATVESGAPAGFSASQAESTAVDTRWPTDEALALYAAASRLVSRGGNWVLGLTRQPVHDVRSPDTKRQIVATVYAWPVVEPGVKPTSDPRTVPKAITPR